VAEGIEGVAGAGGQSNSDLSLGADLAAETIEVPEWFRAYHRAALIDTFLTTPEPFITWIIDRVARQGIPVSIKQIQGFNQFTGRFDQQTSASTTSTGGSYVDLADGAHPELTELGKGTYILLYGCKFSNSANQSHNLISVSVNGAAASDSDAAWFENGPSPAPNLTGSVARATVKDLGQENNTVTAKYKQAGGATMTAESRWLIALKIANL
jgi:hypothetical protein